MLVQRSWPLLLVPGGVVVGHGAACLIGTLVGGEAPLWQTGLLGPLVCLSVPLSFAGLTRAFLGGLRAENATRRLRVLVPCQVGLFLCVELLERAGEPGASRVSWLLVGLAGQLAATAMLRALSQVAGAVGTRLRERRSAPDPLPPHAQGPIAAVPSRLALILGFESLCRRGPPAALA